MDKNITITETKIGNVLTQVKGGFLLNKSGLGPVASHSLQPYRGCPYGQSLCGIACYVRWMYYVLEGREWGTFVDIRTNAADSYRKNYESERRFANRNFDSFTIFCSSSTDPFMPQEFRYGVTKSVLQAMTELPPDVLILQTHTHLVTRYMNIYDDLASKCQLRFHVSIETDRDEMPGLPPHASPLERRLDACKQLRDAGHRTVVIVAPLLPIDDPLVFFSRIAEVADAVVIDHFIIGDGTANGTRTMKTALPKSMNELNPRSVKLDYRDEIVDIARQVMPGRVGVSADGFAASISESS